MCGVLFVAWISDPTVVIARWTEIGLAFGFKYGFLVIAVPPFNVIELSVWFLLYTVSIATGVIWLVDRRRPAPGYCRCAYDLTGNVSGTCPECGRVAAEEGDQARSDGAE